MRGFNVNICHHSAPSLSPGYGVVSSSRHGALLGKGQRALKQQHISASLTAVSPVVTDLGASGDLLSTILVSGISLSIAINVGISALPLLVGASDARKLKRAAEDEDDDIKWSVMTLLSFFPLLNWLVDSHKNQHCNRSSSSILLSGTVAASIASELPTSTHEPQQSLHCRLGCSPVWTMRTELPSITPMLWCTYCPGSAEALTWIASQLPAWLPVSSMFRYGCQKGTSKASFPQ